MANNNLRPVNMPILDPSKNKLTCYLSIFLLASLSIATSHAVAGYAGFSDAAIGSPFRQILEADADLSENGGVRLVKIREGELALIGVSSFVPDDKQREDRRQLVRIGAIKARAKILRFSHGVEVSTLKGSAELTAAGTKASGPVSLTTFFQATKETVSARVEQLPVIGSWWGKDRHTFCVAIGKVKKRAIIDMAEAVRNAGLPAEPGAGTKIDGRPLFVSLLHACPALRKNGGARVFSTDCDKKVVLSVASAKLEGSRAQAEKVARIRAVRQLLANSSGIRLSSVVYLADREGLRISDNETQYVMLSDFLSIQEETVSGYVTALPVVARWEAPSEDALNICIGKTYEKAMNNNDFLNKSSN